MDDFQKTLLSHMRKPDAEDNAKRNKEFFDKVGMHEIEGFAGLLNEKARTFYENQINNAVHEFTYEDGGKLYRSYTTARGFCKFLTGEEPQSWAVKRMAAAFNYLAAAGFVDHGTLLRAAWMKAATELGAPRILLMFWVFPSLSAHRDPEDDHAILNRAIGFKGFVPESGEPADDDWCIGETAGCG